MDRRVVACLIFAATLLSSVSADAQGAAPPQPIVTADHEPWYLSGEPLTYEGYFFYPTGPLTAFNRNEMVRSGSYRGIPLYARTTYEPWSVVFVPLAGGFMQPYIRRRSGEIGGTLGSIGPGLPVERADTSRALTSALQAPGPPTGLMDTPLDRVRGAEAGTGAAGTVAPVVVGTAGTVSPLPETGTSPRVVVLPHPRPLVTAARPTGVNGVFVEFDNARWFGSGSAEELDSTFRRIGEYHGFPVYARDASDSRIYIPLASNVRNLVVPYTRRP
jgi:hypothetical protein